MKQQRRRRNARLVGIAAALATAGGRARPAAAAPLPVPNQAATPVAGAAQDDRVLPFKIPAGPLDAALAEYRRITGLTVILSEPGIGSVQSRARPAR